MPNRRKGPAQSGGETDSVVRSNGGRREDVAIPRPRTSREDERSREPRVDHRIRVPEVLVIDSDGTKLGVMPTQEALRRAQDQNLNLVEVAPNSRPPVCRILDYGKYKYDQKQDQKRRKKNQVVVEVKEVKFRPKIEKHDFEFKLRHVMRFLAQGDKVKCTLMFRGRELAHTELGEVMLEKVLKELEGKIVVEQSPRLEGRNMTMLLAAKPGAWPKKEKERVLAEHRDMPESLEDDQADDEDEIEKKGADGRTRGGDAPGGEEAPYKEHAPRAP